MKSSPLSSRDVSSRRIGIARNQYLVGLRFVDSIKCHSRCTGLLAEEFAEGTTCASSYFMKPTVMGFCVTKLRYIGGLPGTTNQNR